ncbi:MAG TPA: 4Fe-4S cluster-binding domain-containing protein [Candidatus Rhabdochlamydia sp.]|jgi:4Fe-4S single cluster domain|nr:4Fe-4S cluster-binding domain-containing protein [Candidatus Rhabdochlamydia sp.]
MKLQLQAAFNQPQEYRDLILKHVFVKTNRELFFGKAFICVSFTRFCPVGCKFCFFSSSPATKPKTMSDAFTEEGMTKFIQFANDCNLGYLLVSGGGEPFLEIKHLLRVVEHVKSDRIVLVTSGNWAKSTSSAHNLTRQVYEAFKRRTSPTKLVLRLSVDEEHARGGLGLHPAYNLISIFEQSYIKEKDFILQFHTLFDDPCIQKLYDQLADRIVTIEDRHLYSDAETVVKINPAEKLLKLSSGLTIKVGYAKCFYSNIKVNLKDPEVLTRNLSIFSWDMNESEQNNPSIITNLDGKKGLDFWVNFNGNVTTWGNQVPDNIYNLYEDNYLTVIENTFSDPISLAYLEKGDIYRDKIINEVNPLAVLRAKATNIRDYTGALICEEAITRLYLTIRILQDYFNSGRISLEEINAWPEVIRGVLLSSQEQLRVAYKQSTYSIVDQYLERKISNHLEWLDLLELIKLGHYDLNPEKIQLAINTYNKLEENPIHGLDEVKNNSIGFFHEERIIAMKESVRKHMAQKKETSYV